MMIRMNENRTHFLHKRIMALVAALLVSALPLTGRAEDGSWVNSFDMLAGRIRDSGRSPVLHAWM